MLSCNQSGELPAGCVRAEGGAEAFERCLAEAAETFGWRVHAYVVMRNHFHLALETPKPNLSRGAWNGCRGLRPRGSTGGGAKAGIKGSCRDY